jgi:Secretion system C-terminal sorting domain
LQSATAYEVRLRSRCSNDVESLASPILTVQTLEKIIIPPPPPHAECTDIFEPNNSLSAAHKLFGTAKITGIISDYRDRDWFRLDLPVGTTVKIHLSNLPADYDLRLFDNRFRLVQTSENQGMTDETLSYTTSAGQDFLLIYIYGYNSAFHPAKCYSLEINGLKDGFENVDKSNLRQIMPEKGKTSLRGIEATEGVVLSPNPTNGLINIDLPTVNNATIKVFNTMGELVLQSKSIESHQTSIDLSSVNYGVYLVKIEQNGLVWNKKIVKN